MVALFKNYYFFITLQRCKPRVGFTLQHKKETLYNSHNGSYITFNNVFFRKIIREGTQ